MEKKRAVIIGASVIQDYQRIKSYFKKDDFFIFCDGGLKHSEFLETVPDLIVGDFDSYEKANFPQETIVLPCEKDDTDTFFAAKEACKRGFSDFLLVGVAGLRLDHTFANLSILLYLDNLKFNALLIDDYSEMQIVSAGKICSVEEKFSFFSVINLDGSAEKISISGAKYPLTDSEIPCDYQFGISNEVLRGETALVSVKKGRVLLIKIF